MLRRFRRVSCFPPSSVVHQHFELFLFPRLRQHGVSCHPINAKFSVAVPLTQRKAPFPPLHCRLISNWCRRGPFCPPPLLSWFSMFLALCRGPFPEATRSYAYGHPEVLVKWANGFLASDVPPENTVLADHSFTLFRMANGAPGKPPHRRQKIPLLTVLSPLSWAISAFLFKK